MVDAFFDDTPRKKHTPSNVSGCENACNLDFLLMRWHLLQSSIAAQNYSIERCVFGLNRWTLFYFFVKFHSQFLVPSVKELVSTKTAPTETTKAGSSTRKNSSKLNVNLITVKLEATVAKIDYSVWSKWTELMWTKRNEMAKTNQPSTEFIKRKNWCCHRIFFGKSFFRRISRYAWLTGSRYFRRAFLHLLHH